MVFGSLAVASVPIGWSILRQRAEDELANSRGGPAPPSGGNSLIADGGKHFGGSDTEPYDFTYPTSWTVTSDDDSADSADSACRGVRVASANGSMVRVALVKTSATESVDETALVQRMLKSIGAEGYRLAPIGDVQQLGAFSGKGRQFVAKAKGSPLQLQVLVARVGEGRLLALTTWIDDADAANGRRGVSMIINSLKLKTPS